MNHANTARAALVALVAACALSAPARAQDLNDAKEHFKRGQTHYALGEFTEAVAEFREAYRIRDEPAILFNIAQTMRQLGQYKQAYFHYSQYLSRRPDAVNRSEVEQFMSLMRKKMDADEDAERMRREAETLRPPPVHYPEDQLEEGADAGAAGGTSAAAKHAASRNAPAATTAGGAKGSVAAASADKGAAARPPAQGLAKPEMAAGASAASGAAAGPAAQAQSGTVGASAPGGSTAPAVRVAAAGSAGAGAGARSASAVAGAAAPTGTPVRGAAGPAPREALQQPAVERRWPGRAGRYAGFAALGVGAASEGLALAFHASAQSSANELTRRYQSGTLRPGDSSLKDSVSSKGKLSTVAAISGLVLIATGAALAFAF